MIEQVETLILTMSVIANVFFIMAWKKADSSTDFHRARAEEMRTRWLEAEAALNMHGIRGE